MILVKNLKATKKSFVMEKKWNKSYINYFGHGPAGK